jgi:hypothetical protein
VIVLPIPGAYTPSTAFCFFINKLNTDFQTSLGTLQLPFFALQPNPAQVWDVVHGSHSITSPQSTAANS